MTHIPYGHTLEDERRLFERHDTPDRVRKFLPRGELGKALDRLGLTEQVLSNLLDGTLWQHQIFAGAVACWPHPLASYAVKPAEQLVE